MQVVKPSALVAIAGAKNDDFHAYLLADVTGALFPWHVFDGARDKQLRFLEFFLLHLMVHPLPSQ